MAEQVWFNGKVVPLKSAKVSVLDRGFLYGDGIFESMRAYGGRVFRLDEHLTRFVASAEALRLPLQYGKKQIKGAIGELLEANDLSDAYIRLALSRGVGGQRLSLEGEFRPTVVMTARPFTGYPREFYRQGMMAVTAGFHTSPDSPALRHKSANYLANILAKNEAEEKGAGEAIFVNANGEVAEGAVSNVFIVEEGAVVTPPLSVGILPGVTRGVVLDLCREQGSACREEAFGLARLFQAEEVFLTNSLMEIMPLASIDDVKIGERVPGEITHRLMGLYREATSAGR
ncbi:MAG: branched-chain amino acid aminotransferase [Planctomycetes bacterium]|nr:branched-chain amino acid aminotransferase [Planctomycetota bacterium]